MAKVVFPYRNFERSYRKNCDLGARNVCIFSPFSSSGNDQLEINLPNIIVTFVCADIRRIRTVRGGVAGEGDFFIVWGDVCISCTELIYMKRALGGILHCRSFR
jgi:hypothetical protein